MPIVRQTPAIHRVRHRLSFALCLTVLVPAVHGADYYVSTTGNDSAAGSLAAPWRMIQKAANTAVAGDNVFVRGGVYAERVTFSGRNGTAAQRIVFSSYTGEQAVVDQTGVTPPNGTSALLTIQNSNHITVRGIEFRNYKTDLSTKVPVGIYITGACDGIRLEQNKVHGIWQSNETLNNFNANAHGIAAYGNSATPINNLVLDGNEVYDLRLGASEAVVLNGNVTNFQVTGNTIHDCNNIGIDFIGFEGVNGNVSLDQARGGVCADNVVFNIDTQFNPAYGGNFDGTFANENARNNTRAAAGIYVDGGRDITIERNHVHHCNFGIEVTSEHLNKNASGVLVRDNLLRENHVGGLFMGGAGSGNGGTLNCSFTHNTIHQNDTAEYGGGQIAIQHHVSGCVIRHNIIVCNANTHQFVLYTATDGTFAANAINWNLYSGAAANDVEFIWLDSSKSSFTAWKSSSGQDADSFFAASPGFVNAAGLDFSLQSSSAAVGAGDPAFTPASGEKDFSNGDRMVGARVDIGMDEQGAATPVVQFELAAFPSLIESSGPASIRIVRSGNLVPDFDVTFNTGGVGDTAVSPADYTAQSNVTVHFDANQTEVTVQVPLVNLTGVQGPRSFTVALSAPTSGAVLGTNDDATVTIVDDAGVLALGGASFTFNEEAGTVSIPVIRNGGSDGSVGVTVATTNGTALVGSDFNAPATTVTLGDGITGSNITIGILNPVNTTTEANETFTVTISSPTGGAALGTPATATVRIVDSSDSTVPTAPAITAPGVNALVGVNTGAATTVTGTAADNKGISRVEVTLNNVVVGDAALTTPGTTSTIYTLPVTPVTGLNTITVQSFDTRNNPSALVTRKFTATRPLVVNIPSNGGTVTAGFAGSTFRTVGQSLTITATPKTTPAPGFIFTGWTVSGATLAQLGVAASALQKSTLTFIFREGLALTANFTANPFTAVAGTYHGLIRPHATLPAPGGTARTNATEGFFKATVTNTGGFSGTLTIDGSTAPALNIVGAFDHNGTARFGTARALTLNVARTGKPSLVVALQIDLVTPGSNDKITGTVTATDFKRSLTTAVSTVDSDRAFYNGTNLIVPPAYLGASNANGVFTAVFPAKDVGSQTVGFTKLDYPQGDGVGTITITKAGVVTVAGTLADGTAITASSALPELAVRFPLFAQIYTKLGFLSGFVTLDSSQPASDMAASDLQWLRPFQNTSHHYPYGWPEVIKVDMLGAKYAALTGQSVLKAADSGDAGFDGDNIQLADADGNVSLAFSDGQLSGTLNKAANLSTADVVTKVPDNEMSFTLTLNRTTGAVSGTFVHENDEGVAVPLTTAFQGIIYQKGTVAGGYGFFLTRKPTPIDYTGESGGVSLIGQP